MRSRWVSMIAVALLLCVGAVPAQEAGAGDKVAALKQSLQAGMAALQKYEWVETTKLSLKGEQKSVKENRCYYGADGALQKIPINMGQAEPEKSPRGLRGKVVSKKKEEMADYMADVVALVKHYVPPDPARIQAVKDAGKFAASPQAPDRMQLQFNDYLKAGDVLSVNVDPTTNRLLGMHVASYLEKPDDAVTLDVTMTTLQDGALYASKILLNGESESVEVDIQNSGHRPK
jgi:hypothetical protein